MIPSDRVVTSLHFTWRASLHTEHCCIQNSMMLSFMLVQLSISRSPWPGYNIMYSSSICNANQKNRSFVVFYLGINSVRTRTEPEARSVNSGHPPTRSLPCSKDRILTLLITLINTFSQRNWLKLSKCVHFALSITTHCVYILNE